MMVILLLSAVELHRPPLVTSVSPPSTTGQIQSELEHSSKRFAGAAVKPVQCCWVPLEADLGNLKPGKVLKNSLGPELRAKERDTQALLGGDFHCR